MAETEFGLDVEFGHGVVLVGQIEERVVAEAFGAARCGEDFSLDSAVAYAENLSVACGSEDAVVAGCWILDGDFAEGLEKAEVVALVWCAVGWEVLVVGVSGGADAGGSVESVYFEAGVVGDDDVAGRVVGVVDRFEAGVAFEGGFVFRRCGDLLYAGQGCKGDIRFRCGGEVA
jgi:hypothetical protein